MVGLGLSAVSMGLSLFGANQNAKAAQKAMNQQAVVDTASRKATANSMIASVNSQNAKVDSMKRSVEIMQMQAKADGLIRLENYNEMAASAMVMGAASGRVMNEGSLGAIFDKSKSDFMWDNMWSRTGAEINEAAVYQDIENIYEAGSTSLMLGKEQLGVSRLGSMAGQQNTAAQAQQAFNNTLVSSGQSVLKNYGSGLFKLGD